ncbi:YggT family protein [Candidatus Gracilibacteria bacterium]|nr:YggT family protein [Candidatus Gracilibacteria bacterium]
METIILATYFFLNFLQIFIFVDVILSWLTLFGLNIRPKIISDLIDSMYLYVKKYIKTSFGPVDFTPLIILIIISLLQNLIINL